MHAPQGAQASMPAPQIYLRSWNSLLLLSLFLVSMSGEALFAETVDSSSPPFIGFYFSAGGGVNPIPNSDFSWVGSYTYRSLEMTYSFGGVGNVGTFMLFGGSAVLGEIGFQIGKSHTTNFTYWGYSGGISMIQLSRMVENQRGLFAAPDSLHLETYGAGLIAQFTAGVSLFHIIGVGIVFYGSLNTIQPYLAAMVTFQFGYI